MDVATAHEEEHRALLRLAAGGFRDMTRIAASHPAIWLDILTSNRDAVLARARRVPRRRSARRATSSRPAIATRWRELLERARVGAPQPSGRAPSRPTWSSCAFRVPDRPGVLAEVTTLAGRLGVNVADFEIAHSLEGSRGVLVLASAAADADAFEAGLHELGYHTSRSELS